MSNQEETQAHKVETDYDSLYTPTKTKKPTIRELILAFMDDPEQVYPPSYVASAINRKPKSVSKIMNTMWKKGLIHRPYYGLYSRKPTHGAGLRLWNVRPRVQNLDFGVKVVGGVGVHDDVCFDGMFFSVRVMFGSKRGRIGFRASAGLGFDPVGLGVVHAWVVSLCEGLGYDVGGPLDWKGSFEWFSDYQGIHIADAQSITFLHLGIGLVKYYNKPGVRAEARPDVRLPFSSMMQLLGHHVFEAEQRFNQELHDQALRENTATMKYLISELRGAEIRADREAS